MRNERDSVEALIESLIAQTVHPDDIVVADGGSTDGTLEALRLLASRHPELTVIDEPGNRSVGRNAAIRAAGSDLLACIDAGCVADPRWLERLAQPLEAGADWVAGGYEIGGASLWSRCLGLAIVYVAEEFGGEGVLPSARSVAFRRDAWERVGGFPVESSLNEDTVFAERMVTAGFTPFVAAEALVYWIPPRGIRELMRKQWEWGRGDGRAGARSIVYKHLLGWYAAAASLVVAAGWWRRWLIPVALVPLSLSVAWRTRFKYRHAQGMARYLFIPVAHLVATFTTLAGFLFGYGERTWRRRPTS